MNYERALRKFIIAINIPIEKVITDCKNQQDRVIEKIISHGEDEDGNQLIEKRIITFDVNSPNSKIKQYLDKFIDYCREQGNSNTTINQNITLIKGFLKFYNVHLPVMESLKKDSKKWYLLEKEDFKYIMNDSPLIHAGR